MITLEGREHKIFRILSNYKQTENYKQTQSQTQTDRQRHTERQSDTENDTRTHPQTQTLTHLPNINITTPLYTIFPDDNPPLHLLMQH